MTRFLENNDATGILNIRRSSDMSPILLRERLYANYCTDITKESQRSNKIVECIRLTSSDLREMKENCSFILILINLMKRTTFSTKVFFALNAFKKLYALMYGDSEDYVPDIHYV
jgi:hypothetical protein